MDLHVHQTCPQIESRNSCKSRCLTYNRKQQQVSLQSLIYCLLTIWYQYKNKWQGQGHYNTTVVKISDTNLYICRHNSSMLYVPLIIYQYLVRSRTRRQTIISNKIHKPQRHGILFLMCMSMITGYQYYWNRVTMINIHSFNMVSLHLYGHPCCPKFLVINITGIWSQW